MSQINIHWYVTDVSFSDFTLEWTFKLTNSTSLEDIKDEIHYLLPYRDKQRIVKLEYRSPSIDNEGKIELNKFKLKTQANVRAMWDTYFCFKTKIPLKLEAMLQRSVEDILKMYKRLPRYWNVIL